MQRIVGIDLGTTYSGVAAVDERGQPRMIPDTDGRSTVPSVVWIGPKRGSWEVGHSARDRLLVEQERVVQFVKREMGVPVDRVRADGSGMPHPYDFWNRLLSPEDVSSYILLHLRRQAEGQLAAKVVQAVVTVPAYFRDPERTATVRAAELAGLAIPRLLNEPTAAAVAFGLQHSDRAGTALVFDLGGGTFDVTLLQLDREGVQVVATDGAHRLGGKDWDDTLFEIVRGKFASMADVDVAEDMDALPEIRDRVERLKHRLSDLRSDQLVVSAGGKRAKIEITRSEFEQRSAALTSRCLRTLRDMLDGQGTSLSRLDHVILAGGATRMPMIRQLLERESARPLATHLVNPDECVALGAAIIAGQIEAQAHGGLSLRLERKAADRLLSLKLADVTSQNLGFVTLDCGALKSTFVIPKNSRVPCSATREDLTTVSVGQEALDIHVVEGDFEDPFLCSLADSFRCSGIPVDIVGPRLAVTFHYDENALIQVFAEELVSGTSLRVERIAPPILDQLLQGTSTPMAIVLALDVSGSMAGDGLSEVKDAARRFFKAVELSVNRVGIVSFASGAGRVAELGQNQATLSAALHPLVASGSTDMRQGIEAAWSMLAGEPSPCMVLMSDGAPDSAPAAREAANRAKAEGCLLITVATGSAARPFMAELASASEYAYDVTDDVTIAQTFVNLAREIASGSMLRDRP